MPILSVKFHLSADTLAKYEERGPIEKVLSEHLEKTSDYTANKPLYVTDKLRQRLDRLFGKNFQTAEEVVQLMEKYITARIGEVDVSLQPILLQRLKSRCFGKPFEQFLTEQVVRGLEEYTGMR